jgi:hypothetical protein
MRVEDTGHRGCRVQVRSRLLLMRMLRKDKSA